MGMKEPSIVALSGSSAWGTRAGNNDLTMPAKPLNDAQIGGLLF